MWVAAIKEIIVAQHLEKFKVMRQRQHRFVKVKPCATNSLELFDELRRKVDNEELVNVLGFSGSIWYKATSKVIAGIQAYAVGDNKLQWIKD